MKTIITVLCLMLCLVTSIAYSADVNAEFRYDAEGREKLWHDVKDYTAYNFCMNQNKNDRDEQKACLYDAMKFWYNELVWQYKDAIANCGNDASCRNIRITAQKAWDTWYAIELETHAKDEAVRYDFSMRAYFNQSCVIQQNK